MLMPKSRYSYGANQFLGDSFAFLSAEEFFLTPLRVEEVVDHDDFVKMVKGHPYTILGVGTISLGLYGGLKFAKSYAKRKENQNRINAEYVYNKINQFARENLVQENYVIEEQYPTFRSKGALACQAELQNYCDEMFRVMKSAIFQINDIEKITTYTENLHAEGYLNVIEETFIDDGKQYKRIIGKSKPRYRVTVDSVTGEVNLAATIKLTPKENTSYEAHPISSVGKNLMGWSNNATWAEVITTFITTLGLYSMKFWWTWMILFTLAYMGLPFASGFVVGGMVVMPVVAYLIAGIAPLIYFLWKSIETTIDRYKRNHEQFRKGMNDKNYADMLNEEATNEINARLLLEKYFFTKYHAIRLQKLNNIRQQSLANMTSIQKNLKQVGANDQFLVDQAVKNEPPLKDKSDKLAESKPNKNKTAEPSKSLWKYVKGIIWKPFLKLLKVPEVQIYIAKLMSTAMWAMTMVFAQWPITDILLRLAPSLSTMIYPLPFLGLTVSVLTLITFSVTFSGALYGYFVGGARIKDKLNSFAVQKEAIRDLKNEAKEIKKIHRLKWQQIENLKADINSALAEYNQAAHRFNARYHYQAITPVQQGAEPNVAGPIVQGPVDITLPELTSTDIYDEGFHRLKYSDKEFHRKMENYSKVGMFFKKLAGRLSSVLAGMGTGAFIIRFFLVMGGIGISTAMVALSMSTISWIILASAIIWGVLRLAEYIINSENDRKASFYQEVKVLNNAMKDDLQVLDQMKVNLAESHRHIQSATHAIQQHLSVNTQSDPNFVMTWFYKSRYRLNKAMEGRQMQDLKLAIPLLVSPTAARSVQHADGYQQPSRSVSTVA